MRVVQIECDASKKIRQTFEWTHIIMQHILHPLSLWYLNDPVFGVCFNQMHYTHMYVYMYIIMMHYPEPYIFIYIQGNVVEAQVYVGVWDNIADLQANQNQIR